MKRTISKLNYFLENNFQPFKNGRFGGSSLLLIQRTLALNYAKFSPSLRKYLIYIIVYILN